MWIEKDAGKASGFSNEEFVAAGANVTSLNEIVAHSTVQVFISELTEKSANLIGKHTELLIAPIPTSLSARSSTLSKVTATNKSLSVVDLSAAHEQSAKTSKFNTKSNMTTLAAYRSVFEGFYHLNKVARPLLNSAGRSPAAEVLVIGADPLGLTLANIAKQYGANVQVFDRRDALKHTIRKAGFTPIEFV